MGFITSYVRWFVSYIKSYLLQKDGVHVEILSFFDMDKGGVNILHMMNKFADATRVTDFESKIKYPTKWVALRLTYLDYLINIEGYDPDQVNLMTCIPTCVTWLQNWLNNNEQLLSDAQDPNDPNANHKAISRRKEIEWMISNEVLASLAAVPVHQMIDDMEMLINEAI